MKEFLKKHNQVIAWSLSVAVVTLAIFGWGSAREWEFRGSLAYTFFPLLGILAFSLMWTHYIMHALRVYSGFDAGRLKEYKKITGLLVLVALLLHPGLLIMQLYADGYGLPPVSYEGYVDDSLLAFVMLGTVSWLAFLAYEFKDKYSSKSWWKYVSAANAVAMILILIHGANLGNTITESWFSIVWTVYGLSLLGSYVYLLTKKQLI